LLGGECYNPAAETVEFCVYDKIDQSVYGSNVKKCTGAYYFLHIPENTKVPSLTGKFICLKRKYDKKDKCDDHCPTSCDIYEGKYKC